MNARSISNNCVELDIGNNLALFSYGVLVAIRVGGQAYRTSDWYSTTTSKHINSWLQGSRDVQEVEGSKLEDLYLKEVLNDQRSGINNGSNLGAV